MLILPAIDLRDGRVVRLRQGNPDEQTTYSESPASAAQAWFEAGAEWLHVVDLDGAFAGEPVNIAAIRSIVAAAPVPIEVGGGIRSVGTAAKLLALGVSRVIFGTVAVTHPEIVGEAVERFGAERIVVGLDSKNGNVAVRGWTEASSLAVLAVARHLKESGVVRVIHTDIARDGMFTGPDIETAALLARETGLSVIASGGVGSLADIRRVAEKKELEGVIVGKALYDGAFTLQAALEIARNTSNNATGRID
ncbi:MAG TPA: 1-(5-phosphoribosyl)-5-[(5-phosphoribosylamino)methylideneamino]imidazole-4-carboxamide isomerase [Candidatus Latescibacteria bacterium]|nr:1-(5-phosphoribosyl)-5-[(5-phosphoribosylamino)methylideneamino]imidazole-4-carboxamide isomerase [Candidatus Latescibacterota bacterium]HOF60069.1 1-(5-phosphoribosyl)-5-[(5-phosphoribosylamino)methylideneamino]imidazole-4-carboxamide isomerase [Candidatus Latescibacterota bacterium]HOS63352.1 1-(5-phosphoribosyl)-5-[(5-phosphoribosylamino)methylideneamino]imidazole-4-carboxamide isomerase [Candidatus Latescibacterota bacterium]HPK74465.1 1-(5-phosphoribosyl)-5-[(5-phosphoribosylamino)methyl